MSNKINRFFVSFLFFFPLLGKTAPLPAKDSLLNKADQLFQYEDFTPAIDIYEGLVEEGYFQEELLYRLAFMHEQQENYPEAIYYLRKIQWEIGGDNLNDKVNQLMDKGNRERLSAGDSWGTYRLFVNHWQWWLLGALVIFSILSGLLVFMKFGPIPSAIGLVSGGLAVIIGIILIQHLWFNPPKAVIMKSTAFYELPAYSSPFSALPIGVGATVTIIKKEDIWVLVSMGKFEGWVPNFVIKEI